MTCEQHGCTAEAVAAMLWPGRDLRAVCPAHLDKARGIADAMGFRLQECPVAARELQLASEAVVALTPPKVESET